jgi:hypothetical protein
LQGTVGSDDHMAAGSNSASLTMPHLLFRRVINHLGTFVCVEVGMDSIFLHRERRINRGIDN